MEWRIESAAMIYFNSEKANGSLGNFFMFFDDEFEFFSSIQ